MTNYTIDKQFKVGSCTLGCKAHHSSYLHGQAFIAAWQALGELFLSLPNSTTRGSLMQNLDDPTLFYSFGPWPSLEAIEAMRANPAAQQAIQRVRDLCDEASPGTYRLILELGS